MSTPMTTAGRTGIPTKTIAIIAVVAVLVLLASLFAVRSMVGSSTPDAPSGLSVSYEDGKVKAVWNTVSGADEYVLVRDDSTVAYSGSESKAEDLTATAGEHTYRVRAANSGRWSAESAETKVAVLTGWGQLTQFVTQFPDLLPKTPDAEGWQGITCRSMVRALLIERGPSDHGSGDPLVRARMHCFTSDISLQPMWMTSKNAVDQLMSEVSKDDSPESISWRYGTGYVVESARTIYLRFSDRDDLVINLSLKAGGKKELLDLANSMPLEK
ncbi:hypothetical protein ACH46_03660 [Gordonia phthalatica]|uniref:Fibronectin type-III domain-containing protein n=2 Tax=Gordonia phthalatica TaxID=1136941 RepID=A0A0N9NES5_9ACTN|nr:hypothetical protein ACH46_03660 [Gordonia phthalatica]